MGKHLKVERWFYINKKGNLVRKRVSKELEKQFPLEFRALWQKHGSVQLVKYLIHFHKLSLSEAWAKVKYMFNN